MNWVLLKTFENRASADSVMELLQKNGVRARVDYGALEVGLGGIALYVEAELEHRAKWVTSSPDYSDEELEYLATGGLENNGGKPNETQ